MQSLVFVIEEKKKLYVRWKS